MTNFNPINNYNILNNFIIGEKPSQKQAFPQIPTADKPLNPIWNELLINYRTFEIDNANLIKYLQNLMNMPSSIDKFIKNLDTNTLNPLSFKVLADDLINLKELKELLSHNSKHAQSKILSQIAYLSKTIDSTQLNEIVNVLSSIQVNKESLKELLLLYIPINLESFNKQVDYTNLEEEQREKINNSTLTIMLETINFSNILVLLSEAQNELLVEVISNEAFPAGKFRAVIETISKESFINLSIEAKVIKTQNRSNKQNFKILSNDFVSTNSIIISHIIIKTIFKFDNDFTI